MIENHQDIDINFEIPDTLMFQVINLKHRTDRKTSMIKQLQSIQFNFFEAINGNSINVKELNPKSVPRKHAFRQLRPGEIGCTLSHFTIWQKFQNSTEHFMLLVMEDDIQVPDTFKFKLLELITVLQKLKDWDIIYLTNYRYHNRSLTVKNLYNNLFKTRQVGNGTYGYIINRSFLTKIHQYQYPIIYPIDTMIHKAVNTLKSKINFYRYVPALILPNLSVAKHSDTKRTKRTKRTKHH